jgi:hypothetical protein
MFINILLIICIPLLCILPVIWLLVSLINRKKYKSTEEINPVFTFTRDGLSYNKGDSNRVLETINSVKAIFYMNSVSFTIIAKKNTYKDSKAIGSALSRISIDETIPSHEIRVHYISESLVQDNIENYDLE